MEKIDFKNRNLLVVTDHHFPNYWNFIQPFCDFLANFSAEKYYLILLGDLFHTWFGIKKTLSHTQKKLIKKLKNFQKNGGKIAFLVGNRDIFFSEKNDFLPFNVCSFEGIIFENNKKQKILFTHGNLINQQDKNYLKWRKIVHSFAMKWFVSVLPNSYLKKITIAAEQKLKLSNQEKKTKNYTKEWLRFLSENEVYDFCIVGHFHPEKMVVEQRKNNTGIILEAWMDKPAYLTITPDLKVSHKIWK